MLLVRVTVRNLSVSFEYERTICHLFLALVFLCSRFLGLTLPVLPGVHAVLRTVAVHADLLLLDLLHGLPEADIAEDEAHLVAVLGRDVPGSTAADLGGLGPGALQLAVGLGVVVEQ